MKKWKYYGIILAIIAGIEIFCFNFDVLESRFFDHSSIHYDFELSDGLFYNADNTITVLDSSNASIELSNINHNIENIFLNLRVVDVDYIENIVLSIWMTDEGNLNEFYYAGTHNYLKNSSNSHYLRIHSYGNTQNIRLGFDDLAGHVFSIDSIQFNSQVPLHISWMRILIMVFIFAFIEIYRPSSLLYSYNFSSKPLKKSILFLLILGVFMTEIGVYHFMVYSNPMFIHNETSEQYMQYEMLAESFSQGHLDLQIEPEKALLELENPYDPTSRTDFHLDHAFYRDRYFVYFGAVPVLLYYLPYYIITGQGLENATVIFISLIMFAFGVIMLFYEVIKRFFPKTSVIFFILIILVVTNGSGASYIARKPDLYSVPIAVSLMLISWGLWFWLRSTRNPLKMDRTSLLLGSLCIALVAGCRPQMVLVSFLAIPIFWDTLKNIFKSKQALIEFSIAITPFLIVAALLTAYNYARFGSPLNFGANYNLTTNDMTKRGFNFNRIGIGAYEYLFQLPKYSATFPYIQQTDFSTNYLGITIYEPMFGGFFMTHLVCWSLGLSFWIKEKFSRRIIVIVGILLLVSCIIILMDVQLAGILPRYISDFGFFVLLATTLVLFTITQNYANMKVCKLFLFFIAIICLFGLSYDLLMLLIYDQSNLSIQNPYLFYKLMGLLCY
ncbi:hypothetical protein [Holdemania massiliensis]|uniref:hypothetical protein n=1 Tax=Holdemania massiliensis TaxID=1468449 RepID=UPI003520DEF6